MPAVVNQSIFSAIIESSDDAILSKTLDGVITSWNPAATRIFGYTAEEMVGSSVLRLFPADRLREEVLILARIANGERVDHFETVRLHKSGRPITVSVTISPVRDEYDRIVGASKIMRDVTERHRAEERMRLMDSVFSHSSEAIVVTDVHGTIIEVNEAFTQITGYTRQDVIGRDPSLFRSGRQGPDVYRAMLSSLHSTGHCQGEVWSRRKNGEAYAVMLTVSAVPNPQGGEPRYVAQFSDITSLREQQEKMERLASYDPLTELPNRLLFSDRLRQALLHALRQKYTVAIAYLDLDGFKAVNDQWGHEAGDELLVTLARRMQQVLRVTDTLARIGGDEFAVVMVDVGTPGQCENLLNRILAACAEPITIQGTFANVSASIGLTLFPQDDGDAEQLMRHADQAMYQAKQLGKNRFQMFDPASDAAARARAQRLAEFSRAIRDKELVLYYQPKVNMRTGEVVGLEALIRWIHPTRGLLSPADFLPLIENHVLIEAVDEWVIETALQQLQTWNDQGLHLNVSINIAPQHLKAENFVDDLLAQLVVFPHVDPTQLELEIVESSSIDDPEKVMDVIARCQSHGLRFALDDFGTGYSSLTYLKQLKVNSLKIDQSFVRDMLMDSEDLTIVQGVIGLAKAFGKTVIAEGVESREHGCKLLQLGCELAQGYGISRPMPPEKVPDWIGHWYSHASWVAEATSANSA